MCLAIPGKIVSIEDAAGLRQARVQFGGIIREASLELVPEAQIGDYVLVHVGFAISRIDEDEAKQTLADLEQMARLTEEVGADEMPEHSVQNGPSRQ
ncbi:MAG TPA: HypC/HybG/HupF family hydrogenase formation chaperone [Terriglobales bacterium]|nr:HypC/HybG/HupF family hydrogenase formation chaperone [Terriglobales bacterium]